MRKIISISLTICLISSVLLSCAKSNDDDPILASKTESEPMIDIDTSENTQEDIKGDDNIEEDVEEEDIMEEITMPADYNRLLDITVLGTENPSGSGIPAFEDADASLFPSVTLASGNMSILLRDWAVTDLSAYVPNGYISLDVKGEAGGETFDVGFDELKNGNITTSMISLDGITAVTSEWTSVSIPISKIVEETGTDLTCARQFLIGNFSSPVHIRNIKISSEDKERSYPAFKVNQIGYKPGAQKRALVTGFAEDLKVRDGDTFELVDRATGEAVYSSGLTLVSEYDELYSGEKMLCADFSEYDSTGTYYLRLPDGNMDDSLSFDIDDNVYDELLINTQRYYYYK